MDHLYFLNSASDKFLKLIHIPKSKWEEEMEELTLYIIVTNFNSVLSLMGIISLENFWTEVKIKISF